MKYTRDENNQPICKFCDEAVTTLGIIGFFATIGLGIAAIWGFDARWMWSAGVLTVVMGVLTSGRS